MDSKDWHRLWVAVKALSSEYPNGIAFIGGIAIYVHGSVVQTPDQFLEFSHDGDLYFPLQDFADLRDEYEVTSDRRLNKHQIIKVGSSSTSTSSIRTAWRFPTPSSSRTRRSSMESEWRASSTC